MMLDATAGNRMIWGDNKQQSINRTVFLDKEYGFRFDPDIIADNTKLPFRITFQFKSILFDPPWGINMPPWWKDKTRAGGTRGDYFGDFKSKRELLSYIHKAQAEFKRYTNRLCLKWGERNVSLFKILPFFRDWREIHRHEIIAKSNVGGRSKNRNWWVIFIRGSASTAKQEEG